MGFFDLVLAQSPPQCSFVRNRREGTPWATADNRDSADKEFPGGYTLLVQEVLRCYRPELPALVATLENYLSRCASEQKEGAA